MSSNNLSFKKNAYKTIDVEYKFSPFYSYYILNHLIEIILKYDESKRTILNEYFDIFKTQYDTNIELNNIKSIIFDGESENKSTISQIEGNLKELSYSKADRIREFTLEPNRFSDSFEKYCYLLFENKYNFTELSNSNENLIIIPSIINSNIKNIKDYFKTFESKFKYKNIKNYTKEYLNLIDYTNKSNNIYFLECIFNDNSFTEEEYKKNLESEFEKLIDRLKIQFQSYMTNTKPEVFPYKKIIVFQNTEKNISIDYFKENPYCNKKNKEFLKKYLNLFLKENKYFDINSGVQQFNVKTDLDVPKLYNEKNYDKLFNYYSIDSKDTNKTKKDILSFLIFIHQSIYKDFILKQSSSSKVKENQINAETFQIIYKTNQINKDDYSIKEITINKSVTYNIELSTIGSDIELYGYFSSSSGEYKTFILNSIINNDDLNYILTKFIKNESYNNDYKSPFDELVKQAFSEVKQEEQQQDIGNKAITEAYFLDIFFDIKLNKPFTSTYIKKLKVKIRKKFIEYFKKKHKIKSEQKILNMFKLLKHYNELKIKIKKNKYVTPVEINVRDEKTRKTILLDKGILKKKPIHPEYKKATLRMFNKSYPNISKFNYFNNFMITKDSLKKFLKSKKYNLKDKSLNLFLIDILKDVNNLEEYFQYCLEKPSLKDYIYDDDRNESKILKKIIQLLFQLYTSIYKNKENNRKINNNNNTNSSIVKYDSRSYEINNKEIKHILIPKNQNDTIIKEVIKNEKIDNESKILLEKKNKTDSIIIIDIDLVHKSESMDTSKKDCGSRKKRITKKLSSYFNNIYKRITRKNIKLIDKIKNNANN